MPPGDQPKATVHLAEGIDLPAEDFLESKVALIGKSGRGKSGAVKVLMEELVRIQLPFVAFDPVGVLWGIRSSPDGKGPGLPVLVVGGEHADLPLDRKRGAEMARLVVKENVSVVIDFSDEPKAAYREFVAAFSHEIFRCNDSPRLVIIEEAPELVPQRMRPDMTVVFEAVERLVARGRNKGLGVVLVSQRAATIHKDVLTQIDILIVFGLTAPQDRKALGEWIEAWDLDDKAQEFDKGLASLHVREAWFWAPEAFGGIFRKIRIREFTTLHADRTHLRRMGLLKVRPVTADVAAVVARIKGLPPPRSPALEVGDRVVLDGRPHRVDRVTRGTVELDMDAKERKEYEDRIRHAIERGEDALKRLKDIEGRFTMAERRADAYLGQLREAKIAPLGMGTGISDYVAPAAPSSGGPVLEVVDMHVQHDVPTLTVTHREVRINTSTEDNDGRAAFLIAEGFFDSRKSVKETTVEFRERGWGTWSGGAGWNNMDRLLGKLATQGFLRAVDKGYAVVPEAKARITVRRTD